MKKILFAILLIVTISGGSRPAMAVAEGLGNSPYGNPEGATSTGSQCDFQKFKDALGARESSGNYGAKNQYGYLGKYQFGKTALIDLGYRTEGGGWTGKDGVNSEADFLSNHQAQENAMNQWADQMNREVEAAGLTQYIGQNMGGCTVTRSGLLAGRHLKGIGCALNESKTGCRNPKGTLALRAYLESGAAINPTDGNGTPISEYVCKFSGYDTPYDEGEAGSASGCGGGSSYPGTPGAGKTPTSDPDGDGGYAERLDLLSDGIKNNWIAGLMLMAEQFSVNMEKQLEGIGMLFDAKDQAETERLIQQKSAQAHKDYHPSEQMCTFGTFAKDLANTERRADLTVQAVSHQILQREMGSGDSIGKTADSDSISRIKLFRDKFCNPKDNGNGLALLCPKAAEPDMQDRDINYTQAIDTPLTLDIDLTDTKTTTDEETIFSLIDYLFMHDPITRVPTSAIELQKYQYHYQNLRSIVAMRGIARNSFANIVALKSSSPEYEGKSGPYFKALIKEMGLPDDEIEKLLGKNPSYYAQMEFLTKTIYQNPNFYSNLYDKPVNVKRIRAAMNAIKLMNDRDIHDAMLRREMLLSMMLELKLRERAEDVYNSTEKSLFKEN